MSEQIVVIGAGIIGLTSSLRLRQAGFEVSVIAKALPAQTTSAVAGAFWYPYKVAPPARTHAWAERTYQEYLHQIEHGTPGVHLVTVHEFFRRELATPAWAGLVQDFRPLAPAELPQGFDFGIGFSAPLIDTTEYLPHLHSELERAGVEIAVRALDQIEPLFDEYRTVVNCSGIGAKTLAGDDAVYPIRGQVKRVAPAVWADAQTERKILFYQEADAAAYVIPRSSDCVLGGTSEENDWETAPRAAAATRIRQRCEMLCPSVSELADVADAVGLRPGRGEVRLEAEAPCAGSLLIHNYGHGGAGFTLCWACADEVVEIIENPW